MKLRINNRIHRIIHKCPCVPATEHTAKIQKTKVIKTSKKAFAQRENFAECRYWIQHGRFHHPRVSASPTHCFLWRKWVYSYPCAACTMVCSQRTFCKGGSLPWQQPRACHARAMREKGEKPLCQSWLLLCAPKSLSLRFNPNANGCVPLLYVCKFFFSLFLFLSISSRDEVLRDTISKKTLNEHSLRN